MGHSSGNAYCKTQDGAEKRTIRLHLLLPSRFHKFCSGTCVKICFFRPLFQKIHVSSISDILCTCLSPM